MKKINVSALSARQRQEAHNEARVLAALGHPNIVAHRESFLHKGYLCIVMAYADGGTVQPAPPPPSSPSCNPLMPRCTSACFALYQLQEIWQRYWQVAKASCCQRRRSLTGLCRSAWASSMCTTARSFTEISSQATFFSQRCVCVCRATNLPHSPTAKTFKSDEPPAPVRRFRMA